MTKVRQTLQINYSDFIKFARFAIEILYKRPSSLSHNFVFSYATYRHTFRRCLLALGKHRGGSRGRVQGMRTPPLPEMTCGFLIQLVFCKKKLCGLLVLN